MAQDLINNDFHVNGTLTAKLFSAPNGSITNAAIAASAGVAATKLEHQFAKDVTQAPGSAVVAATTLVHTVRGVTGEVVAIEAITTTPATGADRTVTIDLQKGNASTAFATIMASTIVLNNGTAARTPVSGTISAPDIADGDTLQVVVTVAGAAGAQAQGLLITLTLREDAQ